MTIDATFTGPLLKARPVPRLFLLVAGNYMDILTKLRGRFSAMDHEGKHAVGEGPPPASRVAWQLLPIAAVQLGIWALFAWYLNGWSLLRLVAGARSSCLGLQLDRTRTFLEHVTTISSPVRLSKTFRSAAGHESTSRPDDRAVFVRSIWIQLSPGASRAVDRAVLQSAHSPDSWRVSARYHRRIKGSYVTISQDALAHK